MPLLFTLLIWLLILALVCWAISLVPFPPPPAPPWLRNIAYLIVVIIAIVVLLDLVGWVDLGWRPGEVRHPLR